MRIGNFCKKKTQDAMPMKQQMRASAYHLKPADIKKLLIAATNFRDRCILKTLWWLGLRRHELLALDVRDIDFDRKRVTIREGKGGETPDHSDH
jgi:integrase